MKQITLYFAVQVLRRKSGVYILKVLQGDNEWNSKQRNDFEIYYSKYQPIKSRYKIITSLFLQKSLEAHLNSGIQPN